MGTIEFLALVFGTGIFTKGVQALFAISRAIGSHEASTTKCLEHLTKMVEDHEERIRGLESSNDKKR